MFFQILAPACTIGTATIDSKITTLVHNIILIIQIGVPILLVIWGMLDLGKAVIAQKDDEIKAGQKTFIKRLIAAAIVFFVVVIVQFVVSLVGGDVDQSCWTAIING
ncbi:MAG: hypothetical protein PHO63_00520 [Bacilli bacterium]|nr:hypothetical protein [Bacilli bacterium]MDD4809203.1 hypothetical protein [Bacilli bacterium]